MRAPPKARVLVSGTIAAAVGLLAVVPLVGAFPSLPILALLVAAVVATELLQVSSDETSPDPGDVHGISFSSAVHIAVAIIAGPWTAALIAAVGVLVVDGLRGAPWRRLAFNASVFALAAFAAGWAFRLAGGDSGALAFPADFVPMALLVAAYYSVNVLLTSAVVAFHARSRVLPLAIEATRDGLASSAGEAGLGAAVALVVLTQPWAVVVLIPLAIAVFRSYERLAALRRETARALETFANVVDERDAYTYKHSERVAEYVRALAEALELPPRQVAELRLAGRLHDLGKVAIDTSILHKDGRLADEEWRVIRMHPRLSARLLRRFRLASEYARAVEYHHERFDGDGYYGVRADELSLAAHFLIVADTYDAMTSDRPYRDGLPSEVALAEIERNAGTQFHPAVAKAFVALQRGFDPLLELSARDVSALRALSAARPSSHAVRRLLRPDVAAIGGLLAALVALGLGATAFAVPGAVASAAGYGIAFGRRRSARRIAKALEDAMTSAAPPVERLQRITATLANCEARWAGVIGWRERECDASILHEWSGGAEAPAETALTSWLMREVDSSRDVVLARGEEVGGSDQHVVVPLERDGRVAGYLVVAIADSVPPAVLEAFGATSAGARAHLIAPRTVTSSVRVEAR